VYCDACEVLLGKVSAEQKTAVCLGCEKDVVFYDMVKRGRFFIVYPSWGAEGVSGWGGTMASAEHEPITGVWGQSPQRGAEAGCRS